VTKYVALLRGIGPANPNMRNEKLRQVAESVGLEEVATVISSGNVVFETDRTDTLELEQTLEAAWKENLGFDSTTIIRSREELERLVEMKPFGDREHGRKSYLLVTFCKNPMEVDFEIPYSPDDRHYQIVDATAKELFTVTDTTSERTPDVMALLESRFSKEISSRTWLTVARILRKMGPS
jgi:uncharacterized protein (DUF1697 family)